MECRNVLMMNIPCNKGSRKHKSTGERALMDSTLHRGSFEKARISLQQAEKASDRVRCDIWLSAQLSTLTGLSTLSHPICEGAIKIPVDWNPADSFLSIKRGDNEFHRCRDSTSCGAGINQRSSTERRRTLPNRGGDATHTGDMQI